MHKRFISTENLRAGLFGYAYRKVFSAGVCSCRLPLVCGFILNVFAVNKVVINNESIACSHIHMINCNQTGFVNVIGEY